MNAGFTNLETLKAQLLAEGIRSSVDWDAQIQAIGLGVAGAFERFCGRSFGRAVDDVWETAGMSCSFILPRYPIETITALEVREGMNPWEAQTVSDVVSRLDVASGLIQLAAPLGGPFTAVRWTYTGGYWWEQLESIDAGYPTTQPVGSAALPEAIRLAWFLQCGEVWNKMDRTGSGIMAAPDAKAKLQSLELVPQVRDVMRSFIRYA